MKRILAMALSVLLVASMAIGGSIAYLQEEVSDVNVMELGNVHIKQHEYERAVDENGDYKKINTVRGESYELTDYTQSKPLYPAVGTDPTNPKVTGWDTTEVRFLQLADGDVKEDDMHYFGSMPVFAGLNNVQDKFVFVENTGNADAYIRTIIAYEAGSLSVEEWDKLINTSVNSFWLSNKIGIANIDGNNYFVTEYVYDGNHYNEQGNKTSTLNGRHPDGIVHPGDWTYCNLAQVYMHPEGTNEDCEKLDGNKNGTFDILVVSQAVQATGFEGAQIALDTAFGDITTTNHPWVDGVEIPVIVNDVDGLIAALKANGNITLGKDIDLANENWISIPEFSGTLNGNGYAIKNLKGENGLFETLNGATIKNLKIEDADITASSYYTGALAGNTKSDPTAKTNIIDRVTVSGTVKGGDYYTGGLIGADSAYDTVITNCVNNADVSANGQQVGGILGYSKRQTLIEGCTNNGNISGSCIVGGIIGIMSAYDENPSLYVTVKNCENTGEVITTSPDIAFSDCVGDIAGLVGREGGKTPAVDCVAYILDCKVREGEKVYGGVCNVATGKGEHITLITKL